MARFAPEAFASGIALTGPVRFEAVFERTEGLTQPYRFRRAAAKKDRYFFVAGPIPLRAL